MRKKKLPEGHSGGARNGQCKSADRQPQADGGGLNTLSNGLGENALAVCDEIRAHHRERCFAMEQRKRSDLSLGSFLRMALGWRLDLPAADRKRISAFAQDLISCGEKTARGKSHPLAESEEYQSYSQIIQASLLSRQPWDEIEGSATKRMKGLAESLPAWGAFGEQIRGFGGVSLAVIVGEAGDLGNYANHSKLWKRMGLAVIDGKRQGGLLRTSKKAEWIAHGYNRQRRSRMWNIGDALIKNNKDGRYRTCYLVRKEYLKERATAAGLRVVPAAKIPKGQEQFFISEGHIHRSAQRYMEKRLLRDLWGAWRARKFMPEKANHWLPAASSMELAA